MDLLIGFTGPPGCGKDAAADHLVTHHDFRQVAFADPIRKAALTLDNP
jgi:dephospho-CoA kinase